MSATLVKADHQEEIIEFPGWTWRDIRGLIAEPETSMVQVRLDNGNIALAYHRGEYRATKLQFEADIRRLTGEY